MKREKDWPKPQWPDGPEMIEESEIPMEDFNKIRTYIAWGIFALLVIPIVLLAIIAAIFATGALILTFLPVLIAPEQEMRFGAKRSISVRETWKWGFDRDLE